MFSVALIGPDGAGKTTVGRRLEHGLPVPAKYLYMGINRDSSNHMLPTTRLTGAIQRLRGVKPDTSGPRDHRELEMQAIGVFKRVAAGLRSCLSLIIRMSEEWFRQGVASYYQRRGHIVLLDRCYFCDYYAYDIAPARPGRSLARRIHGFMLKHLYPKPKLVIYLDAPAEILFARKGDGSLEVLERRRQDYLEMRNHFAHFALVDATRPLDQVATDVAKLITDFCGATRSPSRTRQRSRSNRTPSILVTDASRGSAIAIIRSLGRRGWRVIAADSRADSPGFQSRYVTERVLYPAPERSPEACMARLLSQARAKQIDLIIPVTDAMILPLSAARERFAGVCKLALPHREALELVADKWRTLELAERLGIASPRTYVVETARDACEKGARLGWPVVLKPQMSRRYREHAAIESFGVCYAENVERLAEQMQQYEGRCPVLLQEYTRGEGHGVELLTYGGRPIAAFQHRRLRELPVSGGPSALRESVALDPIMYRHSVKLLEALEWTGLAMVEFKLAADGPKLMEINGRVWGSLPLATHSGVDFPAQMAELFLYGPSSNGLPVQSAYPAGVRARSLELDLMWMASVLLGRNRYPFLEMPPRRDAVAALLGLLNPTVRLDIQSLDDPGPGMAEIPRILRAFAQKWRNGRVP